MHYIWRGQDHPDLIEIVLRFSHDVRKSIHWRCNMVVKGCTLLHMDLVHRSTHWQPWQFDYNDTLFGKGVCGHRTKLIIVLSETRKKIGI